MPDITNRSKLDALKNALGRLAKSASIARPELLRPIKDLVAALNYEDNVLIQSSSISLLEGLRNFVQDIIRRALEVSELAKSGLRKAWRETVDGVPCDDLEELRRAVEEHIDERLAALTALRDGPVKMLEVRGVPVENAQQLEDGIQDLRELKENIFKDWPPSDKQPSPLNRQAIDEARAAIRRGEKGMRREDMIWGVDPSKKND